MAIVFFAVAAASGCSSDQPEIPEAFADVCADERGCVFTGEAVDAACEELGQPERIFVKTSGQSIVGVVVFVEYPTTGYPTTDRAAISGFQHGIQCRS